MRKQPKKLVLAVQRAVALCFVALAACGHPSASDGSSPRAPSMTETGKLVLQRCPRAANDGGAAAALAMTLAYHGHPVAQETLRKELWLPDGTTNALKLVQSAQAHGLKARGVEVPDQALLTQLPVGSIVHRNDKRFQVLEEIAGGRVTVLDPFDGRQTLPINSFWTGFSKVALLFE